MAVFDRGTTCIAEALVDPAAARTKPARTMAVAVFTMTRLLFLSFLPNVAPER